MLKSFCFKALRLIVLTLFLAQIAIGSASAQEITSPQKVNPPSLESKTKQEDNSPARTDLTKNERKKVTSREKEPLPSKTGRPVDPYSKYYEGIKKFNQELYGEEG